MCSVRIEGAQIGLPAAHALIRQAAKEASVVVVYMHAGAEGSAADHVTGHEEYYLGEDRGNPEAFAHLAIASGASLVIASGLSIGTLFTLFVLPAVYLLIATGESRESAPTDLDARIARREVA